jgi:hypothetical protein
MWGRVTSVWGRVISMWRRILLGIVIVLVLAFLVIQAVPYGRSHSNPPVREEPRWDSPATRELVVGACFDCHSNETSWPWYSNVAPFSWLIQGHVDDGRKALNFSEWDRPQREADEAAEAVQDGEMPPSSYRFLHSSARLSSEEKQALVRGLLATLGGQTGRSENGRERD